MNRSQRRAEAARNRRALDRAEVIRLAYASLAAADLTATGATLIFPDGGTIYPSAADARALHADDSTLGDGA